MNIIVKEAAIFGIGAGIGFLVGKKIYKEKYRKEADEDIAAVKDFKTKRINEMKRNIMDVEIETTEDAVDISEEDLQTNESIVMQYNKIEKEGEVERPEMAKPVTNMSIYVISEEEFLEDGKYDKVSLEYYEEDKVLVDERDIPVDDPDQIIGEGTLDDFVISEDNEMYIRNDDISVDYELTRSEGSYRDFIDGPHPQDE